MSLSLTWNKKGHLLTLWWWTAVPYTWIIALLAVLFGASKANLPGWFAIPLLYCVLFLFHSSLVAAV